MGSALRVCLHLGLSRGIGVALLLLLAPGVWAGELSGRVVAEITGTPLAWLWVSAESLSGGTYEGGSTDAEGRYAIYGLPAGPYRVRANGNDEFLGEYYRDAGWADVLPVTVPADGVPPPVHFVLVRAGAIGGTVTAADTNEPLADVWVHAVTGSGNGGQGAYTDAEGHYRIGGLASGDDYRVSVDSSSPYATYSVPGVLVVAPFATTVDLSVPLRGTDFVIPWAGVTHMTLPDETEVDSLDFGLPYSIASLADVTATVLGPGGFSYVFTTDDVYSLLGAPIELYREFPSLEPGLYTFQVVDGAGNSATRADLHAGQRKTPVVDPATIQYVRNPDGSYRFTWAPVNDTRADYYRLRIRDAAGNNLLSWVREMDTVVDVAAGLLEDGAEHTYRVEVHDAPSFDLLFNRSQTADVPFTPSAADRDANGISVTFHNAYNRVTASGDIETILDIGVNDSTLVTGAVVTGPGGFHYEFDLNTDYFAQWNDFFHVVPGSLTPGLYTFRLQAAEGPDEIAYSTLTSPVVYPAPDPATYQVRSLSGDQLRFSWAGVNHTGALYYRIRVTDTATGWEYLTGRQNTTYADFSRASLGDLSTKVWRVEVQDSEFFRTIRNRRDGPKIPIQVRDTPVTLFGAMRHRTEPDGSSRSDVWVQGGSDAAALTELRVEGPGGYARQLLTDENLYLGPNYSGYQLIEDAAPSAGLYTFTAQDAAGNEALAYDYQPQPYTLPPVDHRGIHFQTAANGDLRVTWSPVRSDIPVWYVAEFYARANRNGDGYFDEVKTQYNLSTTTWTLPRYELPDEPLMFRVQIRDAGSGYLVSNRRQSVLVGYEGPDFDYSTLVDADNDGYADNVDPDDGDATVKPVPERVYSLFDYMRLSGSREVRFDRDPGFWGTVRVVSTPQDGSAGWLTEVTSETPDGQTFTGRQIQGFGPQGWTVDAHYREQLGDFQPLDPPWQLLPAEFRDGDVHEFTDLAGATNRITVVGESDISTPLYAGTAVAVLYEHLGDAAFSERWYFAKGLGLVRSEPVETRDNAWFFGAITLAHTGPPDHDADGLSDDEEGLWGTNPDLADTDGDTLSDGAEVNAGTAPNDADTDGDGLRDDVDPYPNHQDGDGDGLSDGAEVNEYGTDPTLRDTDGDRYDDQREIEDQTDPNSPEDNAGTSDGEGDWDGDGVSNRLDPDDDNDGVADCADDALRDASVGWEWAAIDPAKWREQAIFRGVRDGEVRSAVAGTAGRESNALLLSDPGAVLSLRADVTVFLTRSEGFDVHARVGGFFYNDGSLPGAGDVFAGVEIADHGAGFEGLPFVVRCTIAGCTDYDVLFGDAQTFGPVELASTHTLSVSLDKDTGQFLFGFDQQQLSFDASLQAPVAADPMATAKGLWTNVEPRGATAGSGTVGAAFDNAYVNGAFYDDFAADRIDAAKWSSWELQRRVEDGALLSGLRGAGVSVRNSLNVADPASVRSIEADVVVDEMVSAGGRPRARVAGYFYNDGTSGDGVTGDIYAETAIYQNAQGGLFVRYGVGRCGTADCGAGFTVLGGWSETRPIGFNEPHRLSVTYDGGTTFVFGVDGQAWATTDIGAQAPRAGPAKGDYMALGTKVDQFSSTSAEAYVRARFDNVSVNGVLYDQFPLAENDSDGDGVGDSQDAFPTDPAASQDTDGDGFPDGWNPGYGPGDSTTGLHLDAFPEDVAASLDADLDGFPDGWNPGYGPEDSTTGLHLDAFPEDVAASLDSDLDGYPDAWNPGKGPADSTTGLRLDAFPADPAASLDTDGDGYPDVWNEGMSELDSTTGLQLDAFPDTPNRWLLAHFPAPIPTPLVADYFGSLVTWGAGASIGDEVAVFDPDGVLCGAFVVDVPGTYGIVHVYGDDPSTPEVDEGASEGNMLTFRVWSQGLEQELGVTATVLDGTLEWFSGGVSEVSLEAGQGVRIGLRAGWNLISFPVAMCWETNGAPGVALPTGMEHQAVPSIADVFASIAGKYAVVRSFDAAGAHTYDPNLPDFFNDLTYVAGGYGYWVKMLEDADLVLEAAPLAPTATLDLSAGWNLVGYWGAAAQHVGEVPTGHFPPETAFTPVDSIADVVPGLVGNLIVLRSFDAAGAHTFDPTLPDFFNDLTYLGPGYGYWVKLTLPGGLRYDF